MDDAATDCDSNEDEIFFHNLPDAALEAAAGADARAAFSVYMCTVVDCPG
jgi:hypothetical protein